MMLNAGDIIAIPKSLYCAYLVTKDYALLTDVTRFGLDFTAARLAIGDSDFANQFEERCEKVIRRDEVGVYTMIDAHGVSGYDPEEHVIWMKARYKICAVGIRCCRISREGQSTAIAVPTSSLRPLERDLTYQLGTLVLKTVPGSGGQSFVSDCGNHKVTICLGVHRYHYREAFICDGKEGYALLCHLRDFHREQSAIFSGRSDA